MGTYVLLYNGGSQPATEEEGKAVMDAWMAWFGGLGDIVVDPGNPFGPSATVNPDGSVSDAGVSGQTGYTVIRADDLAAAVEVAKGCPHLAAIGSVEVYETFDIM